MIAQLKYEPHELAKMFPRPTPKEQDDLNEHIKKNGLQDPIILHEGKILDGWSRATACATTGKPARYVEFTDLGRSIVEAGPLQFVIGQNLTRRHLRPSQRAMIAAKMIPALKAQICAKNGEESPNEPARRGRPSTGGKVSARAAAALGVSSRNVETASKLLKKSPDKAALIAAGKSTLNKAAEEIGKRDAQEQAHAKAVRRIEVVCGAELAKAVKNGDRLKIKKDAIAFAAQTDEEMRAQAGLVELGWPLKKAQLFKAKNLTPNHKIEELHLQAARNGNDLTVDIDGWRHDVTRVKAALK